MAIGRPPKPTAVKLAQGSYGHRPLNQDEPATGWAGCVEPPKGLSSRALAHWKEVAEMLDEAKVLTLMDKVALREYCESWARTCEAEDEFNANDRMTYVRAGIEGAKVAPWIIVLQKEALLRIKLCQEFGMTPASRTRIKVRDAGDKAAKNPFAKLKVVA